MNIFSLIVEIASAASAAPTIEPTGAIGTANSEIVTNIINNIYSVGFGWLSAAAGIASVFFILWYGIKYISSGGDSKKSEDAKKGLINTVIGIAIITAVWGIITFATGLGSLISNNIK